MYHANQGKLSHEMTWLLANLPFQDSLNKSSLGNIFWQQIC